MDMWDLVQDETRLHIWLLSKQGTVSRSIRVSSAHENARRSWAYQETYGQSVNEAQVKEKEDIS